MTAVPAVVFFAAALLCSLVGRIFLLGTAFGVSNVWGMTVLLAPFGPLIFRMKHSGLPLPKKNYCGLAVGPLMLLFFLDGGNAESIRSLADFGKPHIAQASVPDEHFHLPVPSQVVAAIGKAEQPPAPAKPAPAVAAKPTATLAPVATPSPAVTVANSAMAAAPKVLSPEERIEANRREFERLAEWYDNLKHERGYLRKGDTDAVQAYNIEAAKYQAALQLAKTEQAELAKLTAKK